jgi:hypothetical protein
MTIRHAIFLLSAIGMIAGVAITTAAPALAGVGSEPGNLKFKPASGATALTPTWSTTDGCPTGYRGSAQMSVFTTGGMFLSSISNVAYDVTSSFSGTLDGKISAILRFAHVHDGGSLEFVVGCYSQIGGTGKFKWLQSTLVTVSSDGESYTTGAPGGQQGSTSGQAAATSATNNAGGTAVSNTSASGAYASGGLGAPALAGLIAAACALVAGTAGFVWYRRRNRSRLM